jgi:hypothetical protein
MTCSVVSDTIVKFAVTPPTRAAVTTENPVPVTVTTLPGAALDGVKLSTVTDPPTAGEGAPGAGVSCDAVGVPPPPPPPPQPSANRADASMAARATALIEQRKAIEIGTGLEPGRPRVRALEMLLRQRCAAYPAGLHPDAV